MIPKLYKEIIRYIILAIITTWVFHLTNQAYTLEEAGKLTLQFAGIVMSALGVLTLIVKFILHSKVSDG